MRQDKIQVRNLIELRQFVSRTLCQLNDFEDGVFQVTEKILIQCGKACGILFCLHGPRSVKSTAVWETVTNTIIFYGSTGEKVHRAQLPSTAEHSSS